LEGWRKLVAGALLGVAGTIYATDEEARRNLPRKVRDLPDDVRRRFKGAVSAGREASYSRRQEILRDLESHGGGGLSQRPRRDGVEAEPKPDASGPVKPSEPSEPRPESARETPGDETEPIDSESLKEAISREERPGGA
jgi:hypothetical protein